MYALAVMRISDRLKASAATSPQLVLFSVFSAFLWVAGGASRSDALSQGVVRGAAWACLVLAVLLFPGRPLRHGRTVLLFLAASAVVAALQLVPLPPEWWSALPGRTAFSDVAAGIDRPAPWRPMAIVPSATLNALSSLIVPFVALYILTASDDIRDAALIKIVLGMVVAGMLVGLLQFASVPISSPFVKIGAEASGTFANRNHFALMTSLGFVLIPVWLFFDGRTPGWRAPVALALALLLTLAILASGSRAGMVLGGISLVCGLLLARRPLRRLLRSYPKWVVPALIVGIVLALGALVALSVAAGRAASVDRALTVELGQDMRNRSLPTVLAMIGAYLPFGAGLGGFDAVFRLHEPFGLLKPTYFNHAHNDFVEVVLDAGLPGAALLIAGVSWWLWASVRAWRGGGAPEFMLARLGSAILLLVMLASIVDYPARTPMIMAVVVVAALWLGRISATRNPSALPKSDQRL